MTRKPVAAWLPDRGAISVLIILTLLKLLTIIPLSSTGRLKPFIGDNAVEHYIPIARRILAEKRFNGTDSRPDSKMPPAYPLVLAASIAVAPNRFALVAVGLQVAGDLVTALMIWWIGKTLVHPNVGILAGALWVVYPPELLLSTWITAEVLFTAAFVSGLAIYVAAVEENAADHAFVAGFATAIATLFRATTILLPLLLAADAVRHRAYRTAVWLLAGFVVVLMPWFVRNAVVLHDRIPVAVGFGSVFLQGADESTFTIAGKRDTYPRLYQEAARDGVLKPADDRESAIDGWMLKVGAWEYRRRLATRPWSFGPFAAKKFLRLWYATESGGIRVEAMLALCSVPIVVPAFIQLWKIRGSRIAVVVILPTFYLVVLHMVTLPLNRYMLPAYALLMVPASQWWLETLVRETYATCGLVRGRGSRE